MESYIIQGVLKKSSINIVEYSTILRTQIGFGENTLIFSKS